MPADLRRTYNFHMLPILFAVTLFTSLLLLILRHDVRGLLLFLAVASISFFFYTTIVYIAKKGGISETTTVLLFGTNRVRQILLSRVYTVNRLGFMMALGRYLSPYFLLLSALNMANRLTRQNAVKTILVFAVLPLLSIIIYIPKVFSLIADTPVLMKMVVSSSKFWIFAYLAFIVVIMTVELLRVKLQFFRLRFIMKVLLIFSLGLSYGLFCPQDPAQVYLFYTNEYMWMMGLWYLHRGFSSGFYYVIIIGSMGAGLVSIASLIRYFAITFGEGVAEVKIRRRSLSAARGVSMFVHGTKNDLLASRILLEKLERNNKGDENIERLLAINQALVDRLEKMNRSIKVNSIRLYPVRVSRVMEEALSRVRENFGDYPVRIAEYDNSRLVLADSMFLAEALYNIMQNGIEATLENGRHDPLEVEIAYGRLWVEITISDRGRGIGKEMGKHLWEPFMSSKNSSTNWGIGMYFTRLVVTRHMGRISFTLRKDGGTSFDMILPLAGQTDEPDVDNIAMPLWKYWNRRSVEK